MTGSSCGGKPAAPDDAEWWRPGTKQGRTLYRVTSQYPEGELVGLVDSAALADLVCTAVNRHLRTPSP